MSKLQNLPEMKNISKIYQASRKKNSYCYNENYTFPVVLFSCNFKSCFIYLLIYIFYLYSFFKFPICFHNLTLVKGIFSTIELKKKSVQFYQFHKFVLYLNTSVQVWITSPIHKENYGVEKNNMLYRFISKNEHNHNLML